MKYSEAEIYFKRIAEQHIAIAHRAEEKHFYRMSFEEIAAAERTILCLPALVLEGYSGNIDGISTDNLIDNNSIDFMILGKASADDFNKQSDVLDEMQVIGDDIISRIRKEHIDFTAPFKGMKIRDIHYTAVKMFLGKFCGWRYSIRLYNQKKLVYNPVKWQ